MVDSRLLSHYQVLGAEPGADHSEIRRKYLAAALSLHPDRQSAASLNQEGREDDILSVSDILTNGTSSVDYHHRVKELGVEYPRKLVSSKYSSAQHEQFLRVQEAWETLRDPESRASYDKYLSAQRLIHQCEESSRVIGEEVYIEEMDITEGNEYSYACRCGDCFLVSVEDVAEAGLAEGPNSGGRSESERICKHPTLPSLKGRQRTSLILPCQSCSLHVRLLFDSETG
ncbi:hypothetical protein R1flu_018393 [Riccia fluitans]|uniref:DPH4 homolog n=1 Tax=Riccia fluitans TaxID=41844 RepID=A0ABD1ZFP7_9MARC